ncbi:serine/threonine protein kinase [Virgisporangium aurantiacum]|uniref:non-specific serine/threonine protein kinase n=1 Tax=Virgisporangium aurantiacum TaxID=175570 RepID=A0A8J4DWP6_9ACTN|nr:serine/threonine-protein kinase [Virgisporangium aurantiacum]GIJ52721.1 hypothetical protein Vau01_002370 [Virgisporangium aurantiacum]
MQPSWPSDPARVSGYRVLARLGSGGMGQVYLGRARDGTLVAVKVVRDDVAAELFDRFPREVAAAHRATGRYLAELVGADPHGSPAWLATRYVPGVSLSEAVTGAGPLPVPSARALMAGLAAALASIHRADVLHRDLKPGNVLLVADGPRVIDFGIARLLDLTPLTGPGKIWGSPGYLSPEQVTDPDRTGPASDVFALGAVAAYASTGTGPYGDGDGHARIYRLVNGEPDLSRVDPSMRELIARCLSRDPDDRPTPDEIIAELGEPAFGPGWLPPAVAAMIEERTTQLAELIAIAPPVSPAPQNGGPAGSAWQDPPGPGIPPGEGTAPATAAPTRFATQVQAPGAAQAQAPPARPPLAHAPAAAHGLAAAQAPPAAPPLAHGPAAARVPAPASPQTPRRRRNLPAALALLGALAVLGVAAYFVVPRLDSADDAGPGSGPPDPTVSAGGSRPADSRPCTRTDRRDLPFHCEVNTKVAGIEISRIPLYTSTDGTDQPIDYLTTLNERQYFVCHRQGSRYTKGELANHWWALTQGDTGDRFGWVPEIYLLGGENDDPDGGLPVCTDAQAARVT